MSVNGFALVPSIYDRGYADALRVLITIQHVKRLYLLYSRRLVHYSDSYHVLFTAESVAALHQRARCTPNVSDIYMTLIHFDRITKWGS